MNLNEIKELLRMLDETDVTELHLESAGVKVSIKKGAQAGPAVIPAGEDKPAAQPSPGAAKAEKPVHDEAGENLIPIVAPMVGTFYRTPSPEAAPFVEAGQMVTQGQTVCIIEAMKLMNEIEAEISGRIVEILVENGQPVEYGQTLFLLEKA